MKRSLITIFVAAYLASSGSALRHERLSRKLRTGFVDDGVAWAREKVTDLGDALHDLANTIDNWWDGLPNELDVKVWDAAEGEDLTKYPWPEQQLNDVMEKENVGIAISGGGARSMAAAWGQLAALYEAGVLSKARYLNGLSGGAWAVTAYTYNQKSFGDDVLLGGIVEPKDATMGRLAQMEDSRLAMAQRPTCSPPSFRSSSSQRLALLSLESFG